MRLVTMSTALALSLAALSMSTPASAAPAKKEPVAKTLSNKESVARHAAQKRLITKHKRAQPADTAKRIKRKVRRVRQETAEATAGFRFPQLFAFADPVSEARRWIGTNPTDRNTLWCARFMNFVLERAGYRGTGSDAAKSFASYGRRISGPQVGAIAVMTRGKNGGHVGIVSGIDASGNPIIISGNHGHRVAEATYPRGRIYAYVMPN